MPRQTHHLFLIPGFFGFTQFGDLRYFAHVIGVLEAVFRARRIPVKIHVAETRPTASIRHRGRRLLEHMTKAADGDGPIYLIGHSTGGLDARLVISPGVDLATALPVDEVVDRVRAVVTVSTPHRGTPLASFFASLPSQRLLRLLSLGSIYVLRHGRIPLGVALKAVDLIGRFDNGQGVAKSVLDGLFDQLLRDFSPERQAALHAFFDDMARDQSAIPQLTPEGVEILNTTLLPRPGVRCGSVVSGARLPSRLRMIFDLGFDANAQALHTLYRWLHRQASPGSGAQSTPISSADADILSAAFGFVPGRDITDGVVPTRAQLWGEIIHVTWADHLDAIGHFADTKHVPPHYDWLPSGSAFDRRRFEALWSDVGRFIVRHEVG